jgi:hypothetical protein
MCAVVSRQEGSNFLNSHRNVVKNNTAFTEWLSQADYKPWQAAELLVFMTTDCQNFNEFYSMQSELVHSLLSEPIYSRCLRKAGSIPPSTAMCLAQALASSTELNDMAVNHVINDPEQLKSGFSLLKSQCVKSSSYGIELCLRNEFWKDKDDLEQSCCEYVARSISESVHDGIIDVLKMFHEKGVKTFDLDVFGSTALQQFQTAGFDDVTSFLSCEMLGFVIDDAAESITIPEDNLDEQILLANTL